jgi:hypothetical protein
MLVQNNFTVSNYLLVRLTSKEAAKKANPEFVA